MIISHKHKFIFIKTHKTASSSIEMALSKICGPTDIITSMSKAEELKKKELGLIVAQNCEIPFSKYTIRDWARVVVKGKKKKFWNHMPAEEIKTYIPEIQWNGYYRFCFDRNPYDKMVSWYYWNNRKDKYDKKSFLHKHLHVREADYFRYHIKSKLAVNKVYPYEKMDESLNHLSTVLKLDSDIKLLAYKAKGNVRKNHDPFELFWDSSQRLAIFNSYKKVFDLLGYDKVD